MKKFFLFLSVIVSALFVVSCKESTEDDEYANWTERNKDYIDSIRVVATKSVSANDGEWKIIKNWKLVADGFGSTAVANTQDYVYCKVLESGNQETETPLYTDSVKVHYLGRLIPTKTYPEGQVFDQSFYGKLNDNLDVPSQFLVNGVITGRTTALQYMHPGDVWRIYIPYSLAYGESGNSSGSVTIPGYSTLIFDVELYAFKRTGSKEWTKK